MKNYKKIFVFVFFFFLIVFFGSQVANALEFKPQIQIPGTDFATNVSFEEETGTYYIARYIIAIYQYGVSIGAILATVVLMAAGLMWLTSGGNQEKIGQAKNMISGSIIGLVLLFGSYTLLNTINPELVKFRNSKISNIDQIMQRNCWIYCYGTCEEKNLVSSPMWNCNTFHNKNKQSRCAYDNQSESATYTVDEYTRFCCCEKLEFELSDIAEYELYYPITTCWHSIGLGDDIIGTCYKNECPFGTTKLTSNDCPNNTICCEGIVSPLVNCSNIISMPADDNTVIDAPGEMGSCYPGNTCPSGKIEYGDFYNDCTGNFICCSQ